MIGIQEYLFIVCVRTIRSMFRSEILEHSAAYSAYRTLRLWRLQTSFAVSRSGVLSLDQVDSTSETYALDTTDTFFYS